MGDNLITRSFPWVNVGTFTAADSTPNTCSYATMDALTNTVIYSVPEVFNNAEFRFTGDTNADTIIYDLYASRGNDSNDWFTRVCTITAVCGATAKDSASVLFCDQITVSNEQWYKTLVVADGGTADTERVARLALDACGYRFWAIVPTTIPPSSSNTVDISGW